MQKDGLDGAAVATAAIITFSVDTAGSSVLYIYWHDYSVIMMFLKLSHAFVCRFF